MAARKSRFSDRDKEIHLARVLIAASRDMRIKGHRSFGFTLLDWAGSSRRRAASLTSRDLFGRAA